MIIILIDVWKLAYANIDAPFPHACLCTCLYTCLYVCVVIVAGGIAMQLQWCYPMIDAPQCGEHSMQDRCISHCGTELWRIVCTCVYMCLYTCLCTCLYTCLCTCLYTSICTCLYTCWYTCLCTCLYTCLYTCPYKCPCTCLYTCLYTCPYTCLCTGVDGELDPNFVRRQPSKPGPAGLLIYTHRPIDHLAGRGLWGTGLPLGPANSGWALACAPSTHSLGYAPLLYLLPGTYVFCVTAVASDKLLPPKPRWDTTTFYQSHEKPYRCNLTVQGIVRRRALAWVPGAALGSSYSPHIRHQF